MTNYEVSLGTETVETEVNIAGETIEVTVNGNLGFVGVRTFVSDTEPTGQNVGDFWLDTSGD